MKTLKFASELVPFILSGEKTSTWRIFDDKDLSLSDEISFINKATGEEFAKARIVSVREKTLGEIDAVDFDEGHERFESQEKMLAAYQSYYGDGVTMDTPIKLISFEILKSMKIPSHPLFDRLRSLDLPDHGWAIFGSGPMWVRGIRESSDIDIIVSQSLWPWVMEHAEKIGVKEECDNLEYAHFFSGDIEMYHDWHPGKWGIEGLIANADSIGGMPFVQLETVLEWKKLKGREKDMRDIMLIREYLSNNSL